MTMIAEEARARLVNLMATDMSIGKGEQAHGMRDAIEILHGEDEADAIYREALRESERSRE